MERSSKFEQYKSQIHDAVKEHLPATGPAPEKDVGSLSINREYNKKINALNKVVALKKHEKLHERMVGDIIVPISEELSKNLTKATVTSLGKDAEKYNINIGDIVLYDHFSVFYDWHPSVITNIENIICKFDSNDSPIPVGNYVIAEPTDIQLNPIPENIILLEDSKPKYVYEIKTLGTGIKDFEFPVRVGDLVLLGGDPMRDITLTLSNKRTYLIDVRNIEAFYNK